MHCEVDGAYESNLCSLRVHCWEREKKLSFCHIQQTQVELLLSLVLGEARARISSGNSTLWVHSVVAVAMYCSNVFSPSLYIDMDSCAVLFAFSSSCSPHTCPHHQSCGERSLSSFPLKQPSCKILRTFYLFPLLSSLELRTIGFC